MAAPKIRIIQEVPEVPEIKTTESININVQDVPTVNTWAIKGLPSKGLFYKSELIGRPLTVLEVKKLTTINSDNVEEIINSIVSSAISGINIQDILVNDKLYILYWLRAQTFINDGFKVPFKCPICEKKSEYHFSVSNMDQEYITDDYSEDMLTITNFLNNDILTFMPRTIGNELAVKYYFDNMRDINLDTAILNIAIQIKSVNGKTVNLKEAYEYLTTDAQLFSIITSQMSKVECGLSEEFKVTCVDKGCKGVGYVPLNFRPEFMLPSFAIS